VSHAFLRAQKIVDTGGQSRNVAVAEALTDHLRLGNLYTPSNAAITAVMADWFTGHETLSKLLNHMKPAARKFMQGLSAER
jgi:activator of 2-hydroxyglutaryl-CoA dehydratase